MTDLIRIMQRHGVTSAQLADATQRTDQTIANWRTGDNKPPVYIELVVEAVARQLKPITHAAMYAYRLTEVLGVPRETEYDWRLAGSFPLPARLATALVAWRGSQPEAVTAHERSIIRNVMAANSYYRVTGGWRARPVMGKQLPGMKPHTPSSLIARGFLKVEDGKLTATSKGRDEVDGK